MLLVVRLAVPKGVRSKVVAPLRDVLAGLKPVLVRSVKNDSGVLFEFPGDVFPRLEPVLDAMPDGAFKMQLFAVDDAGLQRVLDERGLVGAARARAVLVVLRSGRLPVRVVSGACSGGDVEYERCKRLLRGLERF